MIITKIKKNHRTSCENHKNHETLGVPFENQENNKIKWFNEIITKIMKILESQKRIDTLMKIIKFNKRFNEKTKKIMPHDNHENKNNHRVS